MSAGLMRASARHQWGLPRLRHWPPGPEMQEPLLGSAPTCPRRGQEGSGCHTPALVGGDPAFRGRAWCCPQEWRRLWTHVSCWPGCAGSWGKGRERCRRGEQRPPPPALLIAPWNLNAFAQASSKDPAPGAGTCGEWDPPTHTLQKLELPEAATPRPGVSGRPLGSGWCRWWGPRGSGVKGESQFLGSSPCPPHTPANDIQSQAPASFSTNPQNGSSTPPQRRAPQCLPEPPK